MAASNEGNRRGDDTVVAEVLSCLSTDIDALATQGPDVLETATCEDVLRQIERATRRLSALQARMVGAITQRRTAAAAHAAQEAGTSTGIAVGRARRAVENFLSDELGMAPSDARATTLDGEQRGAHQQLDRARDTGDVGPRQARLVADFLSKLRTSSTAQLDDIQLANLQAEAIAHASRLDPVELGRRLRRRLGQLDPRRAEMDESARRRHRTAGFTTTDNGMWRLSATLSGVDAGIATHAIERFRIPDTADVPEGQRRAPGQVTADAFVQMCRVALEADENSPTRAGARPHVVVTIDYQTLLDRHGTAEVERVGPVPFGEIRRLLADAGVARLLVDPEGLPMEAGREVRTVPSGLRRALIVRDQGCIASSCSIPARWCQVAHLAEPFRLGGRLAPDNAALMCHYHHARFDLHRWQIQWDAGQPRLLPPPALRNHRDTTDATSRRGGEVQPAEVPDAAPGDDGYAPMRSGAPQLPLFAGESRAHWDARAGPVRRAGPSRQGAGTSGRQAERVCS